MTACSFSIETIGCFSRASISDVVGLLESFLARSSWEDQPLGGSIAHLVHSTEVKYSCIESEPNERVKCEMWTGILEGEGHMADLHLKD